MESFRLPQKVVHAAPLLFRELSEDLVRVVLEWMKRNSAPGKDGIPAEVYQSFPEKIFPKLLQAMQVFLREGDQSVNRSGIHTHGKNWKIITMLGYSP